MKSGSSNSLVGPAMVLFMVLTLSPLIEPAMVLLMVAPMVLVLVATPRKTIKLEMVMRSEGEIRGREIWMMDV